MTHTQAKILLKKNGLSLTKFSQSIGKSTANLRMQAKRNNGELTELYRLAILQFISENRHLNT